MTWTTKTFLKWSAERLSLAGIESPQLESEVLLAQGLHARREDLYHDPDRKLEEAEVALSRSFVERRFLREPVAYILGRREFWGLDFRVTPDVLVPRWETEILIEQFLKWTRSTAFSEPLRILDIGTGSGNIAIVAAREIPDAEVTAVDISPAALEVAQTNAWVHEVASRIRFVRGDLFSCDLFGSFHAILSNPPYIEDKQMPSLMPDIINYEPRQALDGGEQGLDCYKRILSEGWSYLHENGALFMELGNDQAKPVSYLIANHGGFHPPEVTQDLMGTQRVISARKRQDG
ncbi:MAG: release factor glutamine methyltransferase [Nitrospinaceae bacterium]|nr:MAG: release factor glutamine methyltransferase [Nitrospinaceae bacterium]